MLRLVHPAPEGQPTDPPARRRGHKAPALFIADEEARHLRATIKNTGRAYGSVACLAAAIGVKPGVLSSKRRPSAALALAVARAAGMTVEAVLGGKLSAAGRCAACGSRVGDRPVTAAGGAS
jgi:hypothetical protein